MPNSHQTPLNDSTTGITPPPAQSVDKPQPVLRRNRLKVLSLIKRQRSKAKMRGNPASSKNVQEPHSQRLNRGPTTANDIALGFHKNSRTPKVVRQRMRELLKSGRAKIGREGKADNQTEANDQEGNPKCGTSRNTIPTRKIHVKLPDSVSLSSAAITEKLDASKPVAVPTYENTHHINENSLIRTDDRQQNSGELEPFPSTHGTLSPPTPVEQFCSNPISPEYGSQTRSPQYASRSNPAPRTLHPNLRREASLPPPLQRTENPPSPICSEKSRSPISPSYHVSPQQIPPCPLPSSPKCSSIQPGHNAYPPSISTPSSRVAERTSDLTDTPRARYPNSYTAVDSFPVLRSETVLQHPSPLTHKKRDICISPSVEKEKQDEGSPSAERDSTPPPRIPRKESHSVGVSSSRTSIDFPPTSIQRNSEVEHVGNRDPPTEKQSQNTERRCGFVSQPRDCPSKQKLERQRASMNEESDYLRPLLDHLRQSGMVHFMHIYRLTALRQRGRETGQEQSHFRNLQSELDKWHLSILHEIAINLYRSVQDRNFHRIPTKLLSRTKTSDGFCLEIHSSGPGTNNSTRLFQHDYVYHTSKDGMHVIGLVVGKEGVYDLTGIPIMVIDWFDGYKGREELYRIGSIRHEFMKLSALQEMKTPRSAAARTLSFFMVQDTQAQQQLLEEQTRKRSNTPDTALRSPNGRIVEGYIGCLLERSILNEEQVLVLRRSVICCDSWKYFKSADKSELDRFLLVSGVPGCGKTHTAVYLIATLLIYFNKEFLSTDIVPRWNGQVWVLTKTNKALGVFLQRLGAVHVPSDSTDDWTQKAIPCFCRRSTAYLNSDDQIQPLLKKQTDDIYKVRDVPVVLSTFGNLTNLYQQLDQAFGNDEDVLKFIARNLQVVIIDEGSQSVALDLAHFLNLCPSFDGTIIIKGDRDQMGPTVLTGVMEAREYLSRSLFTEFLNTEILPSFIVPHVEMTTQYRMHRDIMALANDVTYRGKMKYGYSSDYHESKSLPYSIDVELTSGRHYSMCLGPVVAYSTSWAPNYLFKCYDDVNLDELKVSKIIISAACHSPNSFQAENIVFLSPYKDQCAAMRQICDTENMNIGIHTVASFQGQESSLVILSLVRRAGVHTGFLDQKSMVSVAITRPIDRLIVIGDLTYFKESISTSTVWADLYNSMEDRGFSICRAEELLYLERQTINPM